MSQPYWIRCPDGPFTTLIAVTTAYLHPETEPDGLEALQERAADDDAEMRTFKAELRQAIRDPHLLPGNELFRHVAYEDGSDEKFLRRLWRDLYGDEPTIPLTSPDSEIRHQ
jgi:hypothetical protein